MYIVCICPASKLRILGVTWVWLTFPDLKARSWTIVRPAVRSLAPQLIGVSNGGKTRSHYYAFLQRRRRRRRWEILKWTGSDDALLDAWSHVREVRFCHISPLYLDGTNMERCKRALTFPVADSFLLERINFVCCRAGMVWQLKRYTTCR